MFGHRVVMVVSLAASVAGCSFTVRGPSATTAITEPPICDEDPRWRRRLDFTGAVASGTAAAMLLIGNVICDDGAHEIGGNTQAYPACAFEEDNDRTVFGLGFVAVAAVYTAAGYISGRRVKACRAAHKRHLEWRERSQTRARQRRTPLSGAAVLP